MTENIKGAFKNFPEEHRPIRIPLEIYDEISNFITSRLGSGFEWFVPSCQKAVGKTDTGDMDIFLNPSCRNTWKDDLKTIFKNYIVAEISNGPQQMFVMNICGNRYMIDFILAKEGSFDYRKKYSKFGTIIPAVVGSFARSLLYKFDQNELSLRLKSKKGNFHNIPLTKDFDTALKILGLDPIPFYEDRLYTAEEVAAWVLGSPRFDSIAWHTPHSSNGQTITTKNKKSHRAIKIKPNVQLAYDLIDRAEIKASWDNTGFKIERMLLGDDFIDAAILKAEELEKSKEKIISGREVMNILGISEGKLVGGILSHISKNCLTKEQALEYIHCIKYKKSF